MTHPPVAWDGKVIFVVWSEHLDSVDFRIDLAWWPGTPPGRGPPDCGTYGRGSAEKSPVTPGVGGWPSQVHSL